VTVSAWIMLIATWSVVAGVSLFLVLKVLSTPPRDGE
jgi:hypothetical protein